MTQHTLRITPWKGEFKLEAVCNGIVTFLGKYKSDQIETAFGDGVRIYGIYRQKRFFLHLKGKNHG